MKLICNLNSLTYIKDYQEIGVSALMVGNDEISSRHAIHLSFGKMVELSENFDVFVLMNQLYPERELENIEEWLRKIKNTNIRGIVFQDFGLLEMALNLDLHQEMMYMPETLNTNGMTLNDLSQRGVNSAFLAREIPLEDITHIAQTVHLPLCVQVHGVMYMAQSFRHLISNYARENDLDLNDDIYSLKVKDNPLKAWIFEDKFGTNIVTQDELCALNYLGALNLPNIKWAFIDTQMMNPYRALEIINIYQDALNSLTSGRFLKDLSSYRSLLANLMKNQPMSEGFYQGGTVYKLNDVRVMDDEKRNQSNH